MLINIPKDTTLYKKVKSHGVEVWSSELEEIRRAKCMCFNCKNTSNCSAAKEFYEICVKHDCAFIMTRCKRFETK